MKSVMNVMELVCVQNVQVQNYVWFVTEVQIYIVIIAEIQVNVLIVKVRASVLFVKEKELTNNLMI